MNDLRFAYRQLLKAPGFTFVAVLALALGIGANTAIFSIVHAILLRPLPFPEQERLVFFGEWSEQVPNMSVSYPNFIDFRDRQRSFEAVGAARSQGFNYVGPSENERLSGAMASAELFSALRVPPLRGRLYSVDEDRPGAERTVLIRETLWRRLFGGQPDVLGRQINLSGNLYTIIGIMPDSFQYPSNQTELWVPIGLFAEGYAHRASHPGIYCVGRLRPGVTFESAQTEMVGIAEQLAAEYPDTNARQSVSMQLLTDRAFGRVRPALFVLMGAAGCVLLIACANVANLQLARAHAREREFAVRAALGAGRARVVRQLLVESLALGLVGAAVGIGIGAWALDALKTFLPANVPRVAEVALDGRVLLFAIVAGVITSVLFGLVPAWHAARQDLRDALAQGGRSGSPRSGRVRAALVITEFALTCVLLIGAGLMLRTLSNLRSTDPGFEVEQVITFNVVMPASTHPEDTARVQTMDRVLERLRRIPGVSSAGLITPLPLSGSASQNSYHIEGEPEREPGRQPTTEYFHVTGETFQILGMPLIAGRPFDERDHAQAPKVAIVDTRFAEKNFGPGVNPIGRRFTFGDGRGEDNEYMEIVGLVPHIQNFGLGQDTREQTYQPYTQVAPGSVTFLVRSGQSQLALADTLRQVMREVAPDLPIFGLDTMEDLFTQSIGTQRLTVVLLGTFAALALLLAALGLYGVLSTIVGQRTREIGVRIALGATAHSVLSLVLRHGLALAGLGLAIGALGALLLTRLLQSVLYEVSSTDPVTFVAVLVVLLLVGVVACWLPARRATKVNPMVALRSE